MKFTSFVGRAAIVVASCAALACSGEEGQERSAPAAGGSPSSAPSAGDGDAPASVGSGSAPGAGSEPGGSAAPALPSVEPTPVLDPDELPADVPVVGIEIGDAERAELDADPWNAPDVLGVYVDESGVRHEGVELNYRGAYQLQNLINTPEGYRNWKVKFPKDSEYLGRREWNYNSEPHLRQKLAYDLMKFAGVRLPDAQHVMLEVNGESFGPYLRYADPDSKGWLKDAFGSAAGDLFKAAHDLPGEEKHFALLTVLGEADADYFLHYDKKLNDEGAAAQDFSNLRAFIQGLNETADAELEAWFEDNFEVARFTSYLVVSNFICNWDSYPQRPKNYWLYQSPVTQKWNYIPWDMDGTFQTSPSFNYAMPTDARIFNEFDQYDGGDGRGFGGPESGEGEERPLVRRMMAIPRYREAYVARYRELLGGVLGEMYLLERIDELAALLEPVVREDQREAFEGSLDDMRSFVSERTPHVQAELAGL